MRLHPAWLLVVAVSAALWCLAAFVKTTRYMLDSDRKDLAISTLSERHWCATAYWIAADLAVRGVERPYDPEHYRPDANEERSGRLPGELGKRFDIDAYPYPPQFLLLPALLLTLTGETSWLRVIWFLVVGGTFAAAVLMSLYRNRDHGRASTGLLIAPALLAAYPLHLTLQVGNVQPLVVALAVLGACAFDTNRRILGGGLLGFAILTKVWPAAVLVPLVVLRRWRELGWTLAWIGAYSVFALLWFGSTVFVHFLDFELEWILDGRAFPFMADERSAAENLSVSGLPHKLRVLGVVEDTLPFVLRPLSVGYAGLVAILLLVGGVVRRSATSLVSVTLATLCLAQLCSPYLASSLGVLAPMWLLLMTLDAKRPRVFVLYAVTFAILAAPLPESIPLRTVWTTVQTVLTMTIAGLALFHGSQGPATRLVATPHSS